MKEKLCWLMIFCLFLQLSALAGGLNRVAGVGTADVGIGVDPDGSWFPHNLGSKLQLREDYLIEVGAEVMIPRFKYRDWRGRKFTSKPRIVHALPAIAFAQRIDDQTVWGVDINTEYGLGAAFKDIWYGMDSESLVSGTYVKPYLSRQLTDRLSVGFGPTLVFGMIDWFGPLDINRVPLPIRVGLKAKGFGYGFQVGAMYQATDKLAFGLNYLSQVRVDLAGDCTISALGLKIRDSVDLQFKFPERIDFAVGYQLREDWLLTFQASHFGYSKNSLDKVVIDFKKLPLRKSLKLDWKDNVALYLGLSRKVNDRLKVGGGVGYMSKAVSKTADFMTPDVVGFSVATRVSYSFNDLDLLLAVSRGWGKNNSRGKEISADVWTISLAGSWKF
jgi:long-subunit fatty acid transport protein